MQKKKKQKNIGSFKLQSSKVIETYNKKMRVWLQTCLDEGLGLAKKTKADGSPQQTVIPHPPQEQKAI